VEIEATIYELRSASVNIISQYNQDWYRVIHKIGSKFRENKCH